MSEGVDQANATAGQSEMLRQAQQQGDGNRDNYIGTNGTTDLGNNTTVSGGSGDGGDVAGSAAGATTQSDAAGAASGSDMAQDQPGYGSNPSQGGQQQASQTDGQVQFTPDFADDGNVDDDLGDGASAASAAGGGAM